MAIALRGTPQINGVLNGADITLTFDSALQEGDLVVVFGGGVRTAAGNPECGISTSGYTQIFYHSLYQYIAFGAWYKVMGASPDAIVVGTGTTSTSSGTAFGCYALSGVHESVFDQTSVEKGPISDGVPDCDAIVTQTDNAWVLALAGKGSVLAGDSTPGSVPGYENNITGRGADTYDITICGATLVKTPAGSEDPGAWSSWSTGSGHRWYAYTLAIKPAGVGGAKMVKVNGVWQPISSSMVKANGIWQPISSQMVHTPAGWKQV